MLIGDRDMLIVKVVVLVVRASIAHCVQETYLRSINQKRNFNKTIRSFILEMYFNSEYVNEIFQILLNTSAVYVCTSPEGESTET